MEKVNYFLQQLINGISCGSIYAMIAIGYSMVYGLLYLVGVVPCKCSRKIPKNLLN